MAQKSFTLYPSDVKAILAGLYKIRSIKPNKGIKDTKLYKMLMFASMAPTCLLKHGLMITEWLNIWTLEALGLSKDEFLEAAMYSPFLRNQVNESLRIPEENWLYFMENFNKIPIIPRNKMLSWLLKPMVLISPGPWLYGYKIWKARNAPFSASFNLYGLFNPDKINTPGSFSLSALPEFVDLYSIDFTIRGVASKHTIALQKFYKAIHLADQELKAQKALLVPTVYEAKPVSIALRATEPNLLCTNSQLHDNIGTEVKSSEDFINSTSDNLENLAPLMEWSPNRGSVIKKVSGNLRVNKRIKSSNIV